MDDDLPKRTTVHDPQAEQELEPSDIGFDPTVAPEDMGVETGRLFKQAMEQTRMAICISDARAPDMPIVFVNQAFVALTGYAREDCVGRNCRFLQGSETDPAAVEKIRACLRSEKVKVVDILNYKKDRTPFWNALHIGPVYDEAGTLTHFYSSQWDVTEVIEEREAVLLQERVAQEMQHRSSNLFTVLMAIVRLTARGAAERAFADKITDRFRALNEAHRISMAKPGNGNEASDLHALTEAILRPYRGEGQGRVGTGGPVVHLPSEDMRTVGLVIHELATNALKYGALSVATGSVEVTWQAADDNLRLDWTESGGPPVPTERPTLKEGGTGVALLQGLARSGGNSLDLDWRAEGLVARLVMPLSDR